MTKRKEIELNRCNWKVSDPLFIEYHDSEWGKPQYNDILLFEMLCLSGQQAGLSWSIVFKKRDNYRKAFHNFDPKKITTMTNKDVESLMNNAGILRNKRKIESIINNAHCYLKLEEQGQNFSKFIWNFVNGTPIVNHWKNNMDIPTESDVSKTMAKVLKKNKFTFIGSTICYAFMQSCGLINDHIIDCHTRKKVKRIK